MIRNTDNQQKQQEQQEQQEQPKYGARMSINDAAKKMTRGNKVAGIIVAICMVVLGVLYIAWPIRTDIFVMYIATVGFVIYGVFQVIAYAKTESGLRNGWTLASGIIFTVLGFLLLFGGPLDMAYTFVFLMAFLALFGGITQISSYAALKKNGQPGAGWVLASGIINLVLGIFFMIAPFATAWAIAFVIGIYLIVGGIALFAESASGNMGRKA